MVLTVAEAGERANDARNAAVHAEKVANDARHAALHAEKAAQEARVVADSLQTLVGKLRQVLAPGVASQRKLFPRMRTALSQTDSMKNLRGEINKPKPKPKADQGRAPVSSRARPMKQAPNPREDNRDKLKQAYEESKAGPAGSVKNGVPSNVHDLLWGRHEEFYAMGDQSCIECGCTLAKLENLQKIKKGTTVLAYDEKEQAFRVATFDKWCDGGSNTFLVNWPGTGAGGHAITISTPLDGPKTSADSSRCSHLYVW